MINKLIGPKGIILFCIVIVAMWFSKGLLFAGGEEQLSFYNFTRSLELFSYPWYAAGTGSPALPVLPRIPYFLILEPLYRLGISSIFLQAGTFLVLMLIGTMSVYYLVKVTLVSELKQEWKKWVPTLAAIFYLLNPFSMTQIWGRGLSYQFFTFALVPSFLLFFVLSLQKRNIIFCIIASFFSFMLSTAYISPSVVITTWSSIGLYLAFYIFTNRKEGKKILLGLFSFIFLFLLWILLNFFWIYPIIIHGGEMLNQTLASLDSIASLKALAANSHLLNIIRLFHREYYDGTYGSFSNNFFITVLSLILPVLFLFSYSYFRRVKHFLFYFALFLVSIFITIGANPPTGWLLVAVFKSFPLLQVLRNPYEKFGINLGLAYAPFFAIGLLVVSERLSMILNNLKLRWFFMVTFVFFMQIILVWPMWKGNFAGGVRVNFWVKVPDYYTQTNNWLNSQKDNFNILHLPLLPEDGITYTWEHPYEGIEISEFLFDKGSIARNFGFNKDYYSVLLERFGVIDDYKILPSWSSDNLDFKDETLSKELAKINVRYIILHFDTNYKIRRTPSPEKTKEYLLSHPDIKFVKRFDKLEIYKVEIPDNVDLIYSPDTNIVYKKINTTQYAVDIRGSNGLVNLYFLQQFHPSWEAYIGSEKIVDHRKIFSYANGWFINKTGDFQVTLKFAQQDSSESGKRVSIIAGFLSVAVLLLYLLKRRKFSL